MPINFNAKDAAKSIIIEHTNAYMQAVHAEFDNNRDMMETMYMECSYILTDCLLEGKYSPMQYNAVRNELGKMIWDVFKLHIKVEDEKEKMEKAAAHAAVLASLL